MAIIVAPTEPAMLKVSQGVTSPGNFLDRFWDKVDIGKEDECWLWTGRQFNETYGAFSLGWRKGKDLVVVASRFALELDDKIVIPKEIYACHTCDNPPCCNPKHLYAGTRKQNVADRYKRGRDSVGEDHEFARLSNQQVIEIRLRRAKGESAKNLAAEFGVTTGWMHKIIRGTGRRYG